jgi:small-conductance mechanosensitive channel
VLGEPQVLGVESLSASGMTLRLTARTKPGRQWAVQRTMTERVVAALRADEVVLAA